MPPRRRTAATPRSPARQRRRTRSAAEASAVAGDAPTAEAIEDGPVASENAGNDDAAGRAMSPTRRHVASSESPAGRSQPVALAHAEFATAPGNAAPTAAAETLAAAARQNAQFGDSDTPFNLGLQAWMYIILYMVAHRGASQYSGGSPGLVGTCVTAVAVLLRLAYFLYPDRTIRIGYLPDIHVSSWSFVAVTWEDLCYNTHATPWYGASLFIGGTVMGLLQVATWYKTTRLSFMGVDIILTLTKVDISPAPYAAYATAVLLAFTAQYFSHKMRVRARERDPLLDGNRATRLLASPVPHCRADPIDDGLLREWPLLLNEGLFIAGAVVASVLCQGFFSARLLVYPLYLTMWFKLMDGNLPRVRLVYLAIFLSFLVLDPLGVELSIRTMYGGLSIFSYLYFFEGVRKDARKFFGAILILSFLHCVVLGLALHLLTSVVVVFSAMFVGENVLKLRHNMILVLVAWVAGTLCLSYCGYPQSNLRSVSTLLIFSVFGAIHKLSERGGALQRYSDQYYSKHDPADAIGLRRKDVQGYGVDRRAQGVALLEYIMVVNAVSFLPFSLFLLVQYVLGQLLRGQAMDDLNRLMTETHPTDRDLPAEAFAAAAGAQGTEAGRLRRRQRHEIATQVYDGWVETFQRFSRRVRGEVIPGSGGPVPSLPATASGATVAHHEGNARPWRLSKGTLQRVLPLSLLVLIYLATPPQKDMCTAPLSSDDFNRTAVEEEFDMRVGQLSSSFGHGRGARLQHQRQLACLHAKFHVLGQIPKEYQHGIFSKGNEQREFDAMLRLSGDAPQTDSSRADWHPEARGMAIKVFGVEGERLLPTGGNGPGERCNDDVQDFVLMSSDYFFTSHVTHYASLLKTFYKAGLSGTISWALGGYEGSEKAPGIWPTQWDFSTVYNSVLIAFDAWLPWSGMYMPLDWRYSSVTAYRNGVAAKGEGPLPAVRWHVEPCPGQFSAADRRKFAKTANFFDGNPNSFLSDNLFSVLNPDSVGVDADVCLQLTVQVQTSGCTEDVDNPTLPWLTRRFQVARIIIPAQDFRYNARHDVCEVASFNPWNGLKDHEPLGAVNYARKLVYGRASRYRNEMDKEKGVCPTLRALESKQGRESGLRVLNVGRGEVKTMKYLIYDMPQFNRLPYGAKYSLPMLLSLFSWPQLDNKIPRILRQIFWYQWGEKPDTGMFIEQEPKYAEKYKDYTDTLPRGDDIQPVNRVPMLTNDNWTFLQEDWVCAYQLVAGLNPMMIIKAKHLQPCPCKAAGDDECLRCLPAELNVTGVNAFLESTHTNGSARPIPGLATLLSQQRLFFVDFHVLQGIPTRGGCALYQPIALLFLEDHTIPETGVTVRRLMPLAIQLTRHLPYNIVYHPGMQPAAHWQFAKTHLLHSDANVHEAAVHLGYTHLAMEPIVVAFHRRLPADSPLMLLMSRHFRHTLDINELGRRTLLAPQGDFEKASSLGLKGVLGIMQNAYRDHSLLRKDRGWSFHDFNFVENLKLRGFDRIPEAAIGGPKDDLPGFHFRDDGFRLWDVIYEYTGLHLAQMYNASGACRSLVLGDASGRAACNEAVQNDTLLHELYFELSDEFHANIAGEVPKFYQGFPKLRKFLATIIFQASAQHSGVNFGQYHWYANPPVRPLQFRVSESQKDHLTERDMALGMLNEDVIYSLRRTLNIITMTPKHTMMTEMRDDKLLTSREDRARVNSLIDKAQHTIEGRLLRERVSRPDLHGIEYPYLLPNRTAASIAI